jgi:TRAP-type C4-dicarboxylate transport system substrate-binding protein
MAPDRLLSPAFVIVAVATLAYFIADGIILPVTPRYAEGPLGADPVQIEAAELSQAYATGVVQAHFTSGSTPWDSKLYEHADYYYDFGAWLPRNTVFVNMNVWEGLDEDTQAAILEAAATAESEGWAKAEELTRWYAEALASEGMTVQPPSDELLGQLSDVGERILENWISETGDAGAEIIEKYRSM